MPRRPIVVGVRQPNKDGFTHLKPNMSGIPEDTVFKKRNSDKGRRLFTSAKRLARAFREFDKWLTTPLSPAEKRDKESK